MRGRLALVCAVVALLLGVFAGSGGVALADEREVSVAQASPTFDPAVVEFGDVAVGQSKTLTLTLRNTTGHTINFNRATGPYPSAGDTTGLDISDTVVCRNKNIFYTETCAMQITFTALRPGEATATLSFYDDYVSGDTGVIPLRGNGVSAAPASTLTVATAQGPYRGQVDLSATLAGCTGSLADRAVALTITTATGSRTVVATTNAGGVATATAVPLTIVTGGVATAIPAGEYLPTPGSASARRSPVGTGVPPPTAVRR